MSRKLAIFMFWIIGFAVGFGSYIAFPRLTTWFGSIVPQFFNESMIGALIAGIIGSVLSTITIIVWANRTA